MRDPSTDTDNLYSDIEEALVRTAQGRGFLAEHARRARAADTQAVLDAVARLEMRLAEGPGASDLERLKSGLAEMDDVIRRTKTDLAEIERRDGGPTRITEATQDLDAVVATTEQATTDILDATEKIQETAWNMREGGFDPVLCDRLDQHATDIYTACAFQDLTAQRIGRIVRSLAMLEQRIVAMNRIWGTRVSANAHSPPLDEGMIVLSNEDIDFVLIDHDAALPGPPADRKVPPPASGNDWIPAIVVESDVDHADEDAPENDDAQADEGAGDGNRIGQAATHGCDTGHAPEDDKKHDQDQEHDHDAGHAATLAELQRLSALGTRDRLRLFT